MTTRPFREGDLVQVITNRKLGYICEYSDNAFGLVFLEDNGAQWWYRDNEVTLIEPASDASIINTRKTLAKMRYEEEQADFDD